MSYELRGMSGVAPPVTVDDDVTYVKLSPFSQPMADHLARIIRRTRCQRAVRLNSRTLAN